MKQDDCRTKWFIDLIFVTFDLPLERLHVHYTETGFWFSFLSASAHASGISASENRIKAQMGEVSSE